MPAELTFDRLVDEIIDEIAAHPDTINPTGAIHSARNGAAATKLASSVGSAASRPRSTSCTTTAWRAWP